MCPHLNKYVVCYGTSVQYNKFYFLSGTEHKHFVFYPFCHFSQTREPGRCALSTMKLSLPFNGLSK